MPTPLQTKIIQFIQQYIEDNQYSPSLTEIALGVGISPNSISLISRHIHQLIESGHLKVHKKGYRNIQVVEQGKFTLPLIGRIAAGVPIEAIEDRHSVDLAKFLKGDNHFVLEVHGDSMMEEGIFDGDLVICKQETQAQEGEIVVALIDSQQATLKRLSYKVPDRITLIPANPNFKPIAYLPHRVQVQGIFVGLLRLRKSL